MSTRPIFNIPEFHHSGKCIKLDISQDFNTVEWLRPNGKYLGTSLILDYICCLQHSTGPYPGKNTYQNQCPSRLYEVLQ